MPRTTHRLGVLLLPLLLLVAACSAGPSARPPVAYRDQHQPVPPAPAPPPPAPVPPLGEASPSMLSWEDCTEQTRAQLGSAGSGEMTYACAQMFTVLTAPENPADGISRVSLLSAGSGEIPLVVVNDISGEPGTLRAARLANDLPPEMLATFRIIGVDRRGTGGSDPTDCVPPPNRAAIMDFDPNVTDRRGLDRLLDSVREASQECMLNLDDRVQSYDSRHAAADLEELRVQLGVPRLHALGYGEGSRVLTTYTELYPKAVGRMVLDGAPDPQLDALGQGESQARSAEETFDVFAQDCVSSGRCPLGPDPRAAVTELIEGSRKNPIPAPDGPIGAGTIVHALLQGLADRPQWPQLVRALDAARHQDGAGLAAAIAPFTVGEHDLPPRLDADLITSCNDTMQRVPPERSADVARDWVGRYPLFGGVFAQRLVWCGLWPLPAEALPVPKKPGLPPIPVINTKNDPFTPGLGSGHMAAQLPSGITINWQGAGHGAVGRSNCVTSRVTEFFVHGTVPPDGMACPA